jgi:hypothetical protein
MLTPDEIRMLLMTLEDFEAGVLNSELLAEIATIRDKLQHMIRMMETG